MNALVSQLFLSFILFQLVMLTVCYAEERICSSLASVYDSNVYSSLLYCGFIPTKTRKLFAVLFSGRIVVYDQQRRK